MKFFSNSKSINTNKNKRFTLTFPWWCLFIVYVLSFLIIGISIFFILVRGIEFGDLKTQKWLTSIVTGFFSSILLSQPIKIICLAIFFSLFCQNLNDEKEEREYIDDGQVQLDPDEIYLHKIKDTLFSSRKPKRVDRLNKTELAYAREKRLKDVEMWSIIQEFIIYAIFFILVCLITYADRESNSFYQVQHLQKYFLNTRQENIDYTQVFHLDMHCFSVH